MNQDPTPKEWDAVNRPAHYNQTGIECISYIEQQLGESFGAYLLGNCTKYLHRHQYKDKPVEDLKKARWYLDKLIAFEASQNG